MELLAKLDRNILFFIQDHIRCAPLDALMRFMTFLGDMGLIWIVVGIILMTSRKTRTAGIMTIVTLGLTAGLNDKILKNIIMRPRPYVTHFGLGILIEAQKSYSFPSGHASSSFAAATAITLFCGKKGALAYIPAALIALSRIYVGVHYPTDIFFGALLGTCMGILIRWAYVVLINPKSSVQ